MNGDKMDLNELKEYAKSRGYSVTMLDRGSSFMRTSSADRFEIWLEGHCCSDKISYCGTSQEAIDEAFPAIVERMKIIKPGHLHD